jgi:flagellar assembly protein FliH
MPPTNNASFTPLFAGGPDKSGLKVAVGKGGKLIVQKVAVTEAEPDPLTIEQIEALRIAAFEEGVQKGASEAVDAHQNMVAAALEQIGTLIGPMIEAMDNAIDQQRRDAAHLAFAIASRLAPALIARAPRVEIEALVDQCLATLKTEPRLVITMNPALIEDLRGPLDNQAERRGFTGRLVLAEDAAFSGADLRIEWAGGGAERDMASVLASIENLISQHVNRDNGDLAADGSSVSHH